jgi:hypothetical protein
MTLHSLLGNLFASRTPRRAPTEARTDPARRRLHLEHLEDRVVLNSYTAATTADLITDIGLADAAGGASTITLSAAPSSPYILTAVNNTTDGPAGLPVLAAGINLTIVGNGDTIERSTASGTPAFRLFDVYSGETLSLQNLTLQNGLAPSDGVQAFGGAIFNTGDLTLSGCTLQNNTAQGANGVWAYGGAIYSIDSTGELTLSGCTLQNNTAQGTIGAVGATNPGYNNGGDAFGGAVYVDEGTATLTNDTFTGNIAQAGAGGNQSSVTGGKGGTALGGGVYVAGGTVALTNDSFTGNIAQAGAGGTGGTGLSGGSGGVAQGGGVEVCQGTATLTNDTLSGNLAQGGNGGTAGTGGTGGTGGSAYGGGLEIDSVLGNTVTLTNTLIAQDTLTAGTGGTGASGGPAGSTFGPDVFGSATSGNHDLIGDGTDSNLTNGTNGNLVGTSASPINPLLGPLQNNGGPTDTMALLTGSPAVATGGAVTTLTQPASATATTIFVQNAGAIASTPGDYFIRIDGEELAITNVNLSTNALTVTRDLNGTSASFNANDPVYLYTDQRGYTADSTHEDIGAYQTPPVAFTSAASITFTESYACTFTVQAQDIGGPHPVLSESPTDVLPAGITFNPTTGVLGGTPAVGSAGTYTLHFTANNGEDGIATQTFTLTVYSQAASQKFVQAMYTDELGRSASATEVAIWVNVLDGSGGQSAVVAGIANSTEASDRVVTLWYQTYLGRAPGAAGVNVWAPLLASQTQEQVLSDILGSTEFFNDAQNMGFGKTKAENYVMALYKDLLGRTPSSTELANQVAALQQVGQQQLALSFLQSTEYRTDVVQGYYTSLLHRSGSAAEVANWVNSGLDLHTIRMGFEGSAEFFLNG